MTDEDLVLLDGLRSLMYAYEAQCNEGFYEQPQAEVFELVYKWWREQ